MRSQRSLLLTAVLSAALSCCEGSLEKLFTPEERTAPLVMKEISRDAEKSSHVILMNGSEKPHFHDRHSFEVTLIKGESRLYFADRPVDLDPRVPVRVERGTLHWAANTGKGYSILQVDFYPPFDGKDRRFKAEKP